MNVTSCTVNEKGLAEIHHFLAEHHKKGRDHFTRAMLLAWAADAEAAAEGGNPPHIEIRSWDSVSGHAEVFVVSEARHGRD